MNGVVLGVVELFDMHLLCTYTYIATPSDSCLLSLSLSLSSFITSIHTHTHAHAPSHPHRRCLSFGPAEHKVTNGQVVWSAKNHPTHTHTHTHTQVCVCVCVCVSACVCTTVSFKCVIISILTSVHANSFVCRVYTPSATNYSLV